MAIGGGGADLEAADGPIQLVDGSGLAVQVSLKQFLPGNYNIDGLTSDGFLVFHDADSYFAADTTSASPTPVRLGDYSALGTTNVLIKGPIVFLTTITDHQNVTGPVVAWSRTSAASPPRELSSAGLSYGMDALSDGSVIAYSKNYDPSAMTVDLVVENFDGKSPPTVVAGAELRSCGAGSRAIGTSLVLQYCVAGNMIPRLVAVDGKSRVMQVLSEAALGWTADPTNTRLLVEDTHLGAFILQLSDGATVGIAGGEYASGVFVEDGDAVAYQTLDRKLKRVSSLGGTATTLLTGPIEFLAAIPGGPDWVLVGTMVTADFTTDFNVASVAAPSTPIFVMDGTGPESSPSNVEQSSFTADGNWLTGYGNKNPVDWSYNSLVAVQWKDATAGFRRKLEIPFPKIDLIVMGTGARIFVEYNTGKQLHVDDVTVDLAAVDLDSGTGPIDIATQVHRGMAPSSDGRTVWFSTQAGIASVTAM